MKDAGHEILDVVFQKYIKAGHPETEHCELEILASHEAFHVRLHVAENSNCSQKLLCELAKDIHPDVRIAVAEHPSLPEEVLLALVLDENADVRYAIAENANLPQAITVRLLEDDNPFVMFRAQQTMRRINPSAIKKLIPKSDSRQMPGRIQSSI